MRVGQLQHRRGTSRLIVLVAVLVVGTGMVAWFWIRPSTQPGADAGQAIAEAFLTDLHNGRAEQAWQSTTAEFKSAQGKESFIRSVKGTAATKEPFTFVSMQTVMIADQPRSEFVFRSESGKSARIVVGRDTGDWRVDRWAPP
jgi:hypothetical protein